MKNLLHIMILCALLTGCASSFQYKKNANLNKVDEEMSTIYVLRPSSFAWALKFGIYQDDKLIGKLGPKSYLSWSVEPDGEEIKITSKSENKYMLTINPQPGKTYFIKQKTKVGFVAARTGLEFIEIKEGEKILEKLKPPKLRYTE